MRKRGMHQGLIKISNRCGNDCFYCGIRRSNKNCKRYTLPREQILACRAKDYILGVRTFVLQGGGGMVTTDIICDIISDIHRIYPDELFAVLLRLSLKETAVSLTIGSLGLLVALFGLFETVKNR